MHDAATVDRLRVLALLRLHGWSACSFQILEPGFSYWFDEADGCVAYVDTGRAWVAAGGPIAPAARLGRVAGRFASAAAAQGRRVVFFATETRFLRQTRFRTLLIGEQPVWDPDEWERTLATSRSMRQQLHRASNKGVAVRRIAAAELRDPGSAMRKSIDGLIARWLATRPLPPMGFLVEVQPFSLVDERRTFVAERDGKVVGLLVAVPIYARQGWLFEDLLRDPQAPNGTSELLIDAGMRAVAAEGSRYVTLGLAPLAGSVSGWLDLVRRATGALYDFRGVHSFRARLRPRRWDAIYMSSPRGTSPGPLTTGVAIYDALNAFARGKLLGFGVDTLLRGPAFVVRLLALLLVPWTGLLALANNNFFPRPEIKWGWIALDLLVAGGLFALATRWRRWLGITLAATITADAVLTAGQIALFNLARCRNLVQGGALALALAAPSCAAIILWHAIGHRRALRLT